MLSDEALPQWLQSLDAIRPFATDFSRVANHDLSGDILRCIALSILVMNRYIPQLSFTSGTSADIRHSLLAE
jgi:hypothetical protein